jgi:hypothetical protein
MLRNVLIQAAKRHNFELVSSVEQTEFLLRKNGNAERYLVLKTMDNLCSIDELHEEVLKILPLALKVEPSFSKNCDLVLVHKLKKLADFKDIENVALAFEEDPFHFKKYFLYFADAEEKLIVNKSYDDFVSVILKMDEFNDYKKDPLKPSLYSVAARTFIKLPFLEVPKSQKSLQSLEDSVTAVVAENKLQRTFASVKQAKVEDTETLMQELINEELENFKTTDSGI